MNAILGEKVGMTQIFDDEARAIPVTVIKAGPCHVTQIRTDETDGYTAVQMSYGEARSVNKPTEGHFAKAGVEPARNLVELRVDDISPYELGQAITVSEVFEAGGKADVSGVSKGKGFQGVMKRHNFRGLGASHGTERKHRSAGSIGGHSTDLGTGPKVKKGKRMAGRMGNARVTVRSLDVIEVDPERNLLMVKGPVPGPNQGLVFIRDAKRLYRSKAKAAS